MSLVISLRVVHQVKDPKNIPTNIFNPTPIGVRYGTNLTFWGILHSTHLKEIPSSEFLSFDIPPYI